MSDCPLLVEHGRPFVEITFPQSGRSAMAWIDTGGGPFIVGKQLAADLGLRAEPQEIDGSVMECVDLPEAHVAGESLAVEGSFARTANTDLITEGFPAEAFIPAHVLHRHSWVFDYPASTLSIDPETEPVGTSVEVLSHARPGWPAVAATIAGEPVNLLVDTGASCNMLSEEFLARVEHRILGSARGAYGLANMNGGPFEAEVRTVRLPELKLGTIELPETLAVGRPHGAFENMMSSGTPIPVEGAIAGNLLQHFRVHWRPAEQRMWLAGEVPTIERVQQVPITLHLADGVATVIGSLQSASAIEVGDEILAVDGTPVAGQPFSRIVAAMQGLDGETKSVQVRRNGRVCRVAAQVVALP